MVSALVILWAQGNARVSLVRPKLHPERSHNRKPVGSSTTAHGPSHRLPMGDWHGRMRG